MLLLLHLVLLQPGQRLAGGVRMRPDALPLPLPLLPLQVCGAGRRALQQLLLSMLSLLLLLLPLLLPPAQ